MTVTVTSACTACGSCISTCPEGAITPAPRRPVVDDALCTTCLACLEVCPVDAIEPPDPIEPPSPFGSPHPIEVASYRIMNERVDLSGWPDGARDVVARMIHATADESFAATARIGETAVAATVDALRRGATVVCDARMVKAGMPSVPHATCLLDEVPAAEGGDTRSAAAIRLAASRHPTGAVWVIGNAPTALVALLDLHAAGRVEPSAVIGLPVGYVGAAEAKARLWAGPLRPVAVTNLDRRGGSPAAAAAVNALARLARGSG